MTLHVAHVDGFPPYVGGDDDEQDEWQASCACGWRGTMRGDSQVAFMDALNHMNEEEIRRVTSAVLMAARTLDGAA